MLELETMWLILLAVAAKAFILATPDATELSRRTLETLPEPTIAPLPGIYWHALARRDTASAGDASICGYYEGSKNSRLACYYGNACVFHAPGSEFPGMAGCCPTTSTTTPCRIFSTCYDSADISATPRLLSSTTDPFVMLCTFDDSAYCHTRTWPDLNVGDVACTDESSSRVETMYTIGSLTDIDDDDTDQVTETLSLSWIADAALLSLRSVTATSTSTTDSSTTATPPSGTDDGDTEGDSASTPLGTIVGVVVGGVAGLILIVVVVVFVWRHKKKTRATVLQPKNKGQLVSHDQMPELQAGDTAGRHELMGQRDCTELPARDVRHELQ